MFFSRIRISAAGSKFPRFNFNLFQKNEGDDKGGWTIHGRRTEKPSKTVHPKMGFIAFLLFSPPFLREKPSLISRPWQKVNRSFPYFHFFKKKENNFVPKPFLLRKLILPEFF